MWARLVEMPFCNERKGQFALNNLLTSALLNRGVM